MDLKFPENFWWGSASSAQQSEGESLGHGKEATTWDYWHSIEPKKFFGGIGPGVTSNVYHTFREDIDRMCYLGMNSFRTSISWARLMPNGEVNEEAVEFYNEYIDALIEKGIEPVICLYHFDMPMSMQNKGGWVNRECVDAFIKFAEKCFELFGHKVKNWMTFNEPIVVVEGCYLYQFHYPAIVDMKQAAQAGYHILLAHAKAVEAYKCMNFKEGRVGIVLNLTPSYPRSDREEDRKAAYIADLFFNRSYLDPTVKGIIPEDLIALLKECDCLPTVCEGDLEVIKNNTVDYLGVNYYQPRRIKERENAWDTSKGNMPDKYFENYEWSERKMNIYRGWEIYEKGIYDIAMNIKENYGNIPWYISENGMGVEGEEQFKDENGMIQDDYRIEFLSNHLKWLHKGIEEGSNCFGYHMWTFIDNWSWSNAYKNRYGFYSVDLDNNVERTIKKSGDWFKSVTEANALVCE